MKKVGIIGGMSWESSTLYYSLINSKVSKRLGGLSSAELIMYSVNFAPIEQMQKAGEWDKAGQALLRAARSLEVAGADFVVLATNTMHKVADTISSGIRVPFMHIADATAEALIKDGVKTVGLLGTKYTLTDDFYKGRLTDKFGINVLVPTAEGIEEVNRIIFDELCMGVTKDTSKRYYLQQIAELKKMGAEGVILGCTEIGMLVKSSDTDIPLYDTTAIHTDAIVDSILG